MLLKVWDLDRIPGGYGDGVEHRET